MMARTRNVKPAYFKNEDLAELPPLARILFAGLWCWADREGRLEDRPKRLKAEILPYDVCDVNSLLTLLADSPGKFIVRYEADGARYISIPQFLTHQNPHQAEKPSEIPALIVQAPDLHQTSTVQEPDKNRTRTVVNGPSPNLLLPSPNHLLPSPNHFNPPPPPPSSLTPQEEEEEEEICAPKTEEKKTPTEGLMTALRGLGLGDAEGTAGHLLQRVASVEAAFACIAEARATVAVPINRPRLKSVPGAMAWFLTKGVWPVKLISPATAAATSEEHHAAPGQRPGEPLAEYRVRAGFAGGVPTGGDAL